MNLPELQTQILDEIKALNACLDAYSEALQSYAVSDHKYRQEQAISFVLYGTPKEGEKKQTDAFIKAMVDKACSDAMYRQRIADADKDGLKARIDAHKTTISALQSLIKIQHEELSMSRFGQHSGA